MTETKIYKGTLIALHFVCFQLGPSMQWQSLGDQFAKGGLGKGLICSAPSLVMSQKSAVISVHLNIR